ncbi:MAG: HypC/HybG/HupF family hydrogenase formation chaperone [Bacteroidota bacterium]
MCLSVPAEIISIDGQMAKASVGGAVRDISLQLVENIVPGDFVLLHTGFAIEKISKQEAEETVRLLNELGEMDDDMPHLNY